MFQSLPSNTVVAHHASRIQIWLSKSARNRSSGGWVFLGPHTSTTPRTLIRSPTAREGCPLAMSEWCKKLPTMSQRLPTFREFGLSSAPPRIRGQSPRPKSGQREPAPFMGSLPRPPRGPLRRLPPPLPRAGSLTETIAWSVEMHRLSIGSSFREHPFHTLRCIIRWRI